MVAFFKSSLLLIFLLCACTLPVQSTLDPTVVPEATPIQATDTPSQESDSTNCAFVWARSPLPELSKEFDMALKDSLPRASGSADAYGENCVNGQGEVVRFLAMETDYYVTLQVDSLEDHGELGNLIEQALNVLDQFPVKETPGPQPGYVGITFEASGGLVLLWFTRLDAQAAMDNGLRGEDLYLALREN